MPEEEGVVLSDEEDHLDVSPLKNMRAVGRVCISQISAHNLNSYESNDQKPRRASSLCRNMRQYEEMRQTSHPKESLSNFKRDNPESRFGRSSIKDPIIYRQDDSSHFAGLHDRGFPNDNLMHTGYFPDNGLVTKEPIVNEMTLLPVTESG